MAENKQKDPATEAVDQIRNTLSPAAIFEQLAEECVELAKCAQKQARFMRQENPTDADQVDLVKETDEEVCDVLVCLEVLGLNPNNNLMQAKLGRWAGRIQMAAQQRQMGMSMAGQGESETQSETEGESESVQAEVIE